MAVEKKARIPEWIIRFSTLLDSSIRIPFTNYRIGIDPIISLIPGLGDAASYVMSLVIIIGIVQKGVSGKLLLKMLGNVLLDFLIGLVPVLGSIGDFAFKANDRNLKLLREYHEEGKHQGTGLWILLLIAGITAALLILSAWITIYVINTVASWFS